MIYLIIDTANHTLNVSLVKDNSVLATKVEDNINEHSKYALVAMRNVFIDAKLKPSDINKILVVNGPGSFTGIRVGVTIAKTFGWSMKKDVIPVSSLKAHILGYKNYDYYISLLDARRGYVYAAIYDRDYKEFLPEQHLSISDLKKHISALTGNYIIVGDLKIDSEVKDIKFDALSIVDHYKDCKALNPHLINPNYLKEVEAIEKLTEVIE